MPRPSSNPFDARMYLVTEGATAADDLVTYVYSAAVGEVARYVDTDTESNARRYLATELEPYVARIKLEAIREHQALAQMRAYQAELNI